MGEALPNGFDRVIADYYDRAPEEARLEQGPFQLEEARTRELIQRYAPPPPAIVLDAAAPLLPCGRRPRSEPAG